MATCGAKSKSTGAACKLPAGYGTSHLGTGRCKFHGGKTPSGPDSVHFKHGRYAEAFKNQFAQHYAAALTDEQPLDLLPELAMQRAMLTRYVEIVGGRKRVSMAQLTTIVAMSETIVKTAVRIIEARNKTALTGAEVTFILSGMRQVLEKYVPDPDQQRAFIDDLRQFVPGFVETPGETESTDAPAALTEAPG